MDALKKIWVIVYRLNDSKLELVLLKPNPEPGMNYDFYVITGVVEQNETYKQAALRETLEEIGVKPIHIFNLEQTITYTDKFSKKVIKEKCFAVQVNNSELTLNEEHISYKWVSMNEFEKMIWWVGPKDQLLTIISSFSEHLISLGLY